jgi:putative DNA primase/helicase
MGSRRRRTSIPSKNKHPHVKNSTINVLTGEFRERQQEDMITKTAHVDYNPPADCLLWKQFIREIMDYKPDVITFVQTVAR